MCALAGAWLMGMHDGKPWREVAHIADRVGSRGGMYWLLTLECGHITTRTKPKFKLFQTRRLAAPYKVRCFHCTGVKEKT